MDKTRNVCQLGDWLLGTHHTSLVIEEFREREVDNCSNSSDLQHSTFSFIWLTSRTRMWLAYEHMSLVSKALFLSFVFKYFKLCCKCRIDKSRILLPPLLDAHL